MFFLLLSAALLVGAKIMNARVDDSSKECRFIRQETTWRKTQREMRDEYVGAMNSKPQTQERMNQLNRLNENLLEHTN